MDGYDQMTNRVKIQEGMANYIRLVGNNPKVYTPEMCSEDLMEYLDSEDVVIKVDEPVPRRGLETTVRYVSVESLIDKG